MRFTKKQLLAAAVLPVSLVASSCRSNQTMWASCAPSNDPWGTDGTYVLLCRDGSWEPIMTALEFVQLAQGKKITIAPVPTRPTTTTTPTTAAPPTTARPTTTVAPTTTSTTTTTTVAAVAPALDSVGPAAGPTVGGTTVILTGSGFTGTTAVSFGGTAATSFSVVSDTHIDAVIPVHAAGTVGVAVTNPAGSSSLPSSFTYRARPTVSAVSPTDVLIAGGETVTVTGTGFVDGETTVYVDGDDLDTTVVSSTQLTFVAPAHALGSVPVRVNTYGGLSDLGPELTYTVHN